jgi:hypothetical protein
MRTVSLALVLFVGCGGDDGGLDADEQATVEQALGSVQTGAAIVDNVEVVLSGDIDPTGTSAEAAAASVASAELHLTPSSCITSTVNGDTATHEFVGCTGRGGRMLSGTVVSTWSQDGACLRVNHATEDFMIDGRVATGDLDVKICRTGTTETRDRTLQLAGTTRNGQPFTMDGTWQVSIDDTTGCATQSGSATIVTPARTIERGDTDLAWCEVSAKPLSQGESLALLKSGTVQIMFNDIFIATFLGGGKVEITDAQGNFISIIASTSDVDAI